MTDIHPSAFVDPKAELGRNVVVGAFAYIGPDVVLGDDCVVHPHAVICGPTTIGARNTFFPKSIVGSAPQDLKYKGGPTRLVIGDDNMIRELVTLHRGTEIDQQSGGVTRLGDHNLLMVGVHVAHDACIGSHAIIGNNVLIAGHVHIEDRVVIGGGSAMHHFVTLGRNAYVGGMTRITSDVPPYLKVSGYDAAVRGFNAEGMRRWKIADESIAAVREAYRILFARRGGCVASAAIEKIEQNGLINDEHVRYLVEFIRRKMAEGVFGRARERKRKDSDADRSSFYNAPGAESNT